MSSAPIKRLSVTKVWEGWLHKVAHQSTSVNAEMKFNIFLPPQANDSNRLPVLYWLSGLTCTEDNFMSASLQAFAADAGRQEERGSWCCALPLRRVILSGRKPLPSGRPSSKASQSWRRTPAHVRRSAAQRNDRAILASSAAQPDRLLLLPSPLGGLNLPGDKDSWDFGEGASFYVRRTLHQQAVNATQEPWRSHYHMFSYVTMELPQVVEANFPVTSVRSIIGHSMGGHGALIAFLKSPPAFYASCSAFAPIAHPSVSQWGIKAFTGYLGPNRAAWAEWDATELIRQRRPAARIVIEQGTEDEHWKRGQLRGDELQQAAPDCVELRLRDGYDHSYYFVSSFIDMHIALHAEAMRQVAAKQ